MLLPWLAMACLPIDPVVRVLLVVAEDPMVSQGQRAELETRLRESGSWLPPESSERALSEEGAREVRNQVILSARTRLRKAESLFRELEDEKALDVLAGITSSLTSVHQEPEALALLARAHLLAGAIYMARGRTQAGRNRLQRALDLDPDLTPSRARYAPQVLMEVAALKASDRPAGRLVVEHLNGPPAWVYLDGRKLGRTPLALSAAPAGRHLLRVSRSGYTSFLSTVDVDPSRDTVVEVRLTADPEVQQIEDLNRRLDDPKSREPLLGLLRQRGDADRVVVARIVPARDTALDGHPEPYVELMSDGGGRSVGPLRQAPTVLERLAQCTAHWDPVYLAPAVAPRTSILTDGRPYDPPKRKWTESPWVWGAAGAVVFGVTAALVASRASEGPPDSVQIQVTPRP